MALLLACARNAIGTRGASGPRAIAGASVGWPRLLELAEWHNMVPLVYRTLQVSFDGDVPSSVIASLRRQSLAIAARNLYVAHELGELLALFAARGIRALALKGPLLAMQAYGDLSARTFNDLDLLVHERDVPQVRAALATRNYRPAQLLSPTVESAAGQGVGQVNLLRNGIAVDLHWRLAPPIFPLGPDLARVWRRAVTVPVAGVDVPALSPEDTLLFLCCHGAKHYWDTFEGIVAVAALINHNRNDLGAVLAEARRLHCERVALLGFALADRLLHAPLPDVILARANGDRAVRVLLARLSRPLLAGKALPAGRMVQERISLSMYDRHRDRARHCLRLATRPQDTDLAAMPLPAPLHALYSAFRPLRLAAKYARTGVHRLRNTRSVR